MRRDSSSACPDCEQPFERRLFLQAAGAAALAGTLLPIERSAYAAPAATGAAETTAGKLFASLSDTQKQAVCFPFEHELRKRISANWHITKPTIESDFYTKDQQRMIDEIVRKITSEDGYERIKQQTEYDDGGLGAYSIAMFGSPDTGKFQWTLTGRHLTLRADGDTVDKTAFGGPIVYGHGEEDASANLFLYQTKQTNEVFKALEGKQREKALLSEGTPKEDAVAIQGDQGKFAGIGVAELSADQKQLVEATLKVLLAPYRQEDVDEVMAILKATGGVEKLHMAFYQQGDLKNDKVWDVWRIEGPAFVWHFRGAPHVHAYINIAQKA